jgi:hypothetical protein
MRRQSIRLVITALTLLAGVTYTQARTPQVTAMTFAGWVQLRTTADQRTTVVSVISGSPQIPATGVVSVAFRLQHGPRAFADYAGPATVVYSRDRLTVAVNDRVGWTFVVTHDVASLGVEGPGYAQAGVTGLAFFWGKLVHDTGDTVFERLTLGSCAADSGGNCSDCDRGGLGEMECSQTCGEGECQTVCGRGYHACCKCPLSCACCPDIER